MASWMRWAVQEADWPTRSGDVWRSDIDVLVYTLQEGIAPRDEIMFEGYWIDQFPTLLNVAGNGTGKEVSPIAQQVITALRAQIEHAKQQG